MERKGEPAFLDIQRQRLSFLVRKSRKLETRLAELRSEDHSMELQSVLLAEDCDENELKEIKQLIDSVNRLKAEYYCLSYQTNVYNGSIPPGLIDYMPDQPVESTLAAPRPSHLFKDQANIMYPDSSLPSSSNDTTPTTPTPTGDAPSTSSVTFIQKSVKDAPSWSCPKCSFSNHPLIAVCEICEYEKHNFNEIDRRVANDDNHRSSKSSRCENTACYCHLSQKP